MNLAATELGQEVNCRVAIRPEFGWRRYARGDIELWGKGYGRVEDSAALLAHLANLGLNPTVADIANMLADFDGHFAVAARGAGWAFAGVDYVRSIPLAFARCGGQWCIDDQALRLRDSAGLGSRDVDPDAALALGMAGYTIDIATLYRGLEQLGPGELVLFAGGGQPQRHRYYCYRPWRADKPDYDAVGAQKALAEATLALVDKTMKSLGDRMLMVPLSAGRNSRLIVSAARHLGYRNVRTFTYGQPGNHEAVASRAIAERLGFPWRFVPTEIRMMRRYFESDLHASYGAFADTLQSAPFVQDLPQIVALKDEGYIPTDAVFCNGNSGDYISGAHVVPEMRAVARGLSEGERLERITRRSVQEALRVMDQLADAGKPQAHRAPIDHFDIARRRGAG